MRDIITFFASSTEEFKDDRVRLGNYIRRMDTRFTDYGYHFQAVLCEDISKNYTSAGSQSVIDRKIRDCQFFYVLVGRKLGKYTEGEFDVALNEYNVRKALNIYTYFRKQDEPVEDSVERFKLRLKRLGHYRADYQDISELERDITLELTVYAIQNAPLDLFLRNAFRGLSRPDERFNPPPADTPERKQAALLSGIAAKRKEIYDLASDADSGAYSGGEEIEVGRHGA